MTGTPYTDATLTECSSSRGRENEPAVAINPRNTDVIVGSSNDYCGVYNDGVDANGAPIASGPIWLGYYRSQNGGASFTSSLVPGYPDDTSQYAARATSAPPRQATRYSRGTAKDDCSPGLSRPTTRQARRRRSAMSGSPRSSIQTGSGGATINDGKEFARSVIVARGSSAPNLLGKFQDKTAIEADRTQSACRDNVYFANSRFVGNGGSNIYFYRSTDHGASFSHGTLLTTSMNDVQDPEIAVTANGHVYVTYDATLHQGNQTHDAILYNKSTDCGATFSRAQLLTTFNRFTYVDRSAATPEPAQVGAEDDVGEDETDAPAGTRRDCGDFTEACASGYTYPRVDASPRATADQYADPSDETIYVVFEQNIPGTETSTGTTFGTSEPGFGGQGGVYFMRLNGANGNQTTPKLIDPTDLNTGQGHQFWADVSADGGTLHFIWYDSRNDPCYSPTRPVGNCANHSVVPSLDVYASRSIDGGTTIDSSTRLTGVSSNPNFEQFAGRTVPFLGDYIWVSSFGDTSFGTWTDYRNTVAGDDLREADDSDTDPGGGRPAVPDRTLRRLDHGRYLPARRRPRPKHLRRQDAVIRGRGSGLRAARLPSEITRKR